MIKPTNTENLVKGVNVTFALSANILLLAPLTRSTTAVSSSQKKYTQFSNRRSEGSSLRGVARISGRAYGTVIHLVRAASKKAQMVHNAFVQRVKTKAITADELWSSLQKNKNAVCLKNLRRGIAGLD